MSIPVERLVFVGFNGNVLALEADTGRIVWDWQPESGGEVYVTLLLVSPNQLVAAVDAGFVYCLDPSTGDELWSNGTKGFGYGVTSIAALGGHAPHDSVIASAAAQAAAAQSSSVGD